MSHFYHNIYGKVSLWALLFLAVVGLLLLLLQGQQHVLEMDFAVTVQIGGGYRWAVG